MASLDLGGRLRTDRLLDPVNGDEHDIDFSNTTIFVSKRWEDAVREIRGKVSSAGISPPQSPRLFRALVYGSTITDREKISEQRDWQTLHIAMQRLTTSPNLLPVTKSLLNQMMPLPRTLQSLVGHFARAINPFEANFNAVWGLLHLNLTLSCVSQDKLTRTSGWSKRLRSVVELFNRCADHCDDMNEARLAMVEVLEYVLKILGESVYHLRHCPTDVEASKEWKTLNERITELLSDMETVVKHLNNITSYTKANLEQQVKNLALRHDAKIGPEEYAKFPILMVPKNQNPDFYGRDDELKRMDTILGQEAATGLRTYTIYGRRGVGKTDIALQYAYKNTARFDAIFWVTCETLITLRQSFTDIAIALDLPNADRDGHHEENLFSVQRWLKWTRRTWLLIFDNAERESILRGYWPRGASGAILLDERITSRRYYNFNNDAQRKGDTVKPFTESQSWELLMRTLGPDWQDIDRRGLMKSSEEKAAQNLLSSIGGLAIAIQQAAQLIQNPDTGGMTIASTYASFLEHRNQLPPRPSGARSETIRSLDALWSMTFNSITRNARDLLGVLSLLSPDRILIDFFLPTNQGALDGKLVFCKQEANQVDDASQVTLSKVIIPTPRLRAAVDELLRWRLIYQEGREIWAHRVVQEAMNYHSFSEIQDYFDSAAALLYEAFPKQVNGDYLSREQRGACTSYISHAAHISLQYSRYHLTDANQSLKGSPQLIKLLHNAAWYLYEVSDYEVCLRVVETAWLACEDKTSLQYAELCNVAGCAYYELNRLGDCRKYWETFLRIQEALLQDNSIELSASYHNMGNLESACDNLEEAVNYFNKAIGIRLKAGDVAAALLANSYLCLSRVDSLRREFDQSLNLLAQSDALFSRIAGSDVHFMAHVHYAYGNLHFAQTRWLLAKKSYETCLRIGLATNATHPITVAAYYSLGCVEFEMRQNDKAKAYLDKALTIAQLRSPSRDDGTIARILWKTSLILEDSVYGAYQTETHELRIRAEIALKNLTNNGEGGLVISIDEDGNADPRETEDSYDSLVPGCFR